MAKAWKENAAKENAVARCKRITRGFSLSPFLFVELLATLIVHPYTLGRWTIIMKWLILPLVLLSACSSLPHNMRGTTYQEISLTAAQLSPNSYINTAVRWGGTIINASNKEHGSRIYALYYPLSRSGRPEINSKTEGRFAISSKDFLDPAIFKEGLEFTMTGTLTGQVDQKIDQKVISIPSLKLQHIHIWPTRQQSDEHFHPYPPYHIYHPYYRYGPYYYDYY